jgi:ATP-dependent helicase/nuclease subunit B
MEDQVRESLRAGATLITANARLARHYLRAYDQGQYAAGLRVWKTADVLPLGAWLRRCWRNRLDEPASGETRLLLRPWQEQQIWEQIVHASSSSHMLLQVPSTAEAAGKAWALRHAWRLDPASPEWHHSQDADVFSEWSQVFERRCRGNHWISAAELPDVMASLLRSAEMAVSSPLLFAGFDEFTPQQRDLLSALHVAGVGVEILAAPQQASGGQAVCLSVQDAEKEIRVAAEWARSLVASDSGAKIGIVVPDLALDRAAVERIFTEVLHPGSLLVPELPGRLAFNISLGLPLLDYPMVQTAFVVLHAAMSDPVPLATLSRLLRTPFLTGGIEERSSRARLDGELRKRRVLDARWAEVLHLASDRAPTDKKTACLILFRGIRRWQKQLKAQPESQRPSQWAAAFSRLLAKIGWPGDRSLNSAEHQTLEKWHELLDELAGLDVAVKALDYVGAVAALQRLAAGTIFQPESNDAPIQVLGMLEASGLSFDWLWVLGLHDEAWPQAPRPNPFLPLALQRKANLPHSSPGREFEFARLIMQRLLASARQVVFSHAEREGDVDRRSSPLLQSIPRTQLDAVAGQPVPSYFSWLQVAGERLETLRDDVAPPVPEAFAQGGGSGLLKSQAACPFQAFAKYRLGAKPWDEAKPGIDLLDRGSLLHGVLERVWRELGSQQQLRALRSEQLQELVEDAIDETLENRAARYLPLQGLRLRAIERQRLIELLLEWLETERNRKAFHILQQEGEVEAEFCGLRLKLRIDRIDKLEDDRHVLIDYKSGEASAKSWDGDRPDQPQLPLYLLTADLDFAALAFARVKRGKLGFEGYADGNRIIAGLKAPRMGWKQQQKQWRAVLERLATAFREGQAAVDPKAGDDTCRLCRLKTLCRVAEGGAELHLAFQEAGVE